MLISFKKFNHWQWQQQLYQEKKISDSAGKLYSFLFTHCIYYHNNGYCGLSNLNISKEIGTSEKSVERLLKELRDKDMIVIKNPNKRTNKTGESRQIHINSKNYITEDIQKTSSDNELLKVIERQSKELEELKKENSLLRIDLAQSKHITEIGYSLIRIGFITEAQYRSQADELNHILLDFEHWHQEGRELSKACFAYWNAHKDSKIKNPVRYILTCIEQSKRWINNHTEDPENYRKRLLRNFEEMGNKND